MDRRHFLGLSAMAAGMLWPAGDASACSIVATNRTPFSDRTSRAAIASWVQFLNEAGTLPDDDLIRRHGDLSVVLEDEWVDEVVGDREPGHIGRDYLFVKEFRLSGGRLDPRPIELEETNLLRRLGNRATYQFTLKRYSYHPADFEGCNGMFTHDEYYGFDRISCLATLTANHLRTVRRFPEWYLEPA